MSLLVLFALNTRAERALKPLRLLRLLNTIFYCTTNHRYTQHPLEPIYTRMHTHTHDTRTHTLELPNGCMMSVWALPAAVATSAPKLQISINASTPQLCPIESCAAHV